ncbi:MAG TPA: serine/threonine-protein kinase, partial [Kofleriaceae bacterium]|nr:serine/threonine-protein kinase [Kofleriaceae bacterium]
MTERPTDALLQQMLMAGEEEDAALAAGSKVGRYVVLELIGGGGMGMIYKAYDPQLDRAVALKLMRPAAAESDPDASNRVLREAQSLAKLQHPNIVAVHDAGLFGDQVFAAMEYVAGDTVSRWLKVEPRSAEEIVDVFRAAGRGLAAAHAAGLVHRDFKPDNVIVGTDGRVRVLDFGLARPAGDAAAGGPSAGTPAYMAPEQHDHRVADARSDQYSFCVALYEAV